MQSVFEGMQFPVYRKYKNNKHFFRVISDTAFEEVQLVGSRKLISSHAAKIMPDRQFIYDLCFGDIAMPITEQEYNSVL